MCINRSPASAEVGPRLPSSFTGSIEAVFADCGSSSCKFHPSERPTLGELAAGRSKVTLDR